MPRLNPLSAPSRLRERRHQRSRRLLASRAVAENLVTVAGLIGRPVRNPSAAEIGTVKDVVARWDGGEYPPVTGLVVRIGRRLAFVPGTQIETLAHREVVLRSARLDLADFERREGEVLLVEDVIDHQLVDVDGVRVIRAADLYVAKGRRDVPPRRRRRERGHVAPPTRADALGEARPTPERVIDWAAIQPFGRPGSPIRLREGNRALHRLRPSELADLLEELGRRERQELLAALEPETAADALEEMDAEELEVTAARVGRGASRRAARGDGARRGRRRVARPRRGRARAAPRHDAGRESGRAATAPRVRGADGGRLDDELPPDRHREPTPWPMVRARLADDADHQG